MARKRKKRSTLDMQGQIKGILLIALAIFCYVGLEHTDQTGGLGFVINTILKTLAGEAALMIPVIIGVFGLRFITSGEKFNLKTRLLGLGLFALLAMIWVHLQFMIGNIPYLAADNLVMGSFLPGLSGEGGGIVGAFFAVAFYFSIGLTGSRILLTALALISALLVINISLNHILNILLKTLGKFYLSFKKMILRLFKLTEKGVNNSKLKLKESSEKRKRTPEISTPGSELNQALEKEPELPVQVWNEPGPKDDHASTGNYQQERQLVIKDFPKSYNGNEEMPSIVGSKEKSFAGYIFPGLDLLSMPRSNGNHHLKNSRERARKLEQTLRNFGVQARVTHVQAGPTVTRFEVQPEAGVKVSKIIGLSDDLALNLAAPLVRIEAPIPGKAALGIEVPNSVISLVHLREVIEENSFINNTSPLTIALGKDITGVPVIADLAKMPHLLIAGATGAGKSVCLNTLITSILYKAHPERLRFMMIDPKVVELSTYNSIPHLLMPVITDPRKASLALRNMVREMGRRYELFARLEARDINTYNQMAARDSDLEKLPYIVVIIDELADLMHVSPGDVEDAIARLAQMSRAAGIHLVVATQRPSVDVLTGIIKANITSRIAFTVSSQFDSRTILDMSGAEKLLGRGDMLFYPVGAVKPFRVQGAFISEDEVKKVTDFIKEQGLVEPEENSAFLETAEEKEEEESDALFAEAVDLVVRTGQASISLLQRRFRIGYTRAARLIDDLERKGIVGQFEGSKPREILVTPEQAAQICEEVRPDKG